MCGIVAAVCAASSAAPVDVQRVESALRALAHRGPDADGRWTAPDRRAVLAHARLAVRDVENGAQPLVSEDGRIVAVVNGELYGADGLRAELRALGHRFRSRGDGEVVLHAWREWGPALVSRLRGEFAFAVWDDRDGVLFAARDRFGVKPLVWARHEGRLLLASRVRGLLALGVPAAWDHDALFQSASLHYAPPDATLFAGVHALPAGHCLLLSGGRVRVREYWDLDPPPSPEPVADERAAVREFGARFDEAVALRLDADVPVAFQLSGGLDSAAVLASAARHLPEPDAFTVSFGDGPDYDEHDRATATARHVGARLHTVSLTDRDLAASFPDAVLHAEAACVNTHAAAKLRLSAAVRAAGFKVALTGEGADEVLFGYAHLRADLHGSADHLAGSNSASTGLMLPDGDGIPLDAVRRTLGYVPTWLAAKASFGGRVRALLRPDWLAAFGDRDPGRTVLAGFDVGRRLAGRGRVEQSAYLWTGLALEGYILRALGDGLEMANGVEGRLPFLDSRVVDHAVALPTRMKIRGGVEKWILREAMRGRLPDDLVAREKHPFLGPPVGPHMLGLAREVLSDPSVHRLGVFDPGRVTALLDGVDAMTGARRKGADPVLLFALSVALLHTGLEMAA